MIKYEDLFELNNHELLMLIESLVAYARKSRPKQETKGMEEKERIEKDLEIQVMRLEEYLERRTWSYQLFKEVKSGEDIENREVFNEVLDIIRSGEVDALLVVDFDRLTRGDASDQKLILTTLREYGVVLLEESSDKLYNPLNEDDLRQLEMKALFANMEYGTINKRNKLGKRYGAKKGNWVKSSIPFGYKKNKETKRLEIDEETSMIYREYILEPFLKGDTVDEIAWRLNKDKILSPRGKLWKDTTIRNILKNEAYLGTVIYNKTKGSKNSKPSLNKEPYRKVPREKWIITPNAHPKLLTKEEFNQVQLLFKVRGKEQTEKKFHPLSGLVKCHYCNETMQIKKDIQESGKVKYIFGKCECGKTSGGQCDLVLGSIYQGIEILEERIKKYINNSSEKNKEVELKSLLRKVSDLEKKIEKHEKAIKNVELDYQMGEYTKQEKNMYIDTHNERIQEYTKIILEIQEKISNASLINNSDKLDRIKDFKETIKTLGDDDFYELRKLMLKIVKRVVWKRDTNADRVDVKVNFL